MIHDSQTPNDFFLNDLGRKFYEIAVGRILVDIQMEELESKLIKEILKNKAIQKRAQKSLELFVSKIN